MVKQTVNPVVNPVVNRVVIGTRGSPLALWQAHYVQARLQSQMQSLSITTELCQIRTAGDIAATRSADQPPGAFTKALDDALLEGKITLAVHSAKDAPSVLADGLEIIAITEKEAPHDVLVSPTPLTERCRIGTSSARRQAQVQAFLPHCTTKPVIGNIGTRLQRLQDDPDLDALMLAYAGIKRLGKTAWIQQHLSTDTFTPAPSQGSLLVVGCATLPIALKQGLQTALHHPLSAVCVTAERSFLRTMHMGCGNPIFGLATWKSPTLTLHAGVYDGGRCCEHTAAVDLTGFIGGEEKISEEIMQKTKQLGILVGERVIDRLKTT